ncbi:uncharacterized protein LOC129804425 isoform X2 [Phlebotomus papatasi]|uniref:uncharacterized protein LOC129804425 isoform X2 n=1 Tax=Phlebotomus papatasi TaxID=29031 RepID=UPI002483A1BD|nr:uncharacterized protein LOC129804425 isoform X2 [Phlebotomus papatasi]
MISRRNCVVLASFLVILISLHRSEGAYVQEFFKILIQDNVAGAPVIHQQQEFDFDPDVSVKRRQQFYEIHGYRADKLIERLGLGIDGKAQERLIQQRIRDQGRLDDANFNQYASDSVQNHY